jgi:hypothetical protein
MSDLSTDALAEARTNGGGNGNDLPPRELVRPVVPGSPMALFQPAVPISDPELPFAPSIDPVAAEQPPTDALRPSDPTELMAVTTADPILELPPEGMLRITKGSESRFIWPVHAQGWLDLGWTVVLPVNPGVQALEQELASAEPAPLTDPTEDLPVSTAVPPDLLLGTAEQALAEDSPTGEVAAVPLLEEPLDYGAMTKAQIIEHCAQSHGVMLDSSLTKAQLVEEAERLDAESALLLASDDV